MLKFFHQHPDTWYTVKELQDRGMLFNPQYLDFLHEQGVLQRCLKRVWRHKMAWAYRYNAHRTTWFLEMYRELEEIQNERFTSTV